MTTDKIIFLIMTTGIFLTRCARRVHRTRALMERAALPTSSACAMVGTTET